MPTNHPTGDTIFDMWTEFRGLGVAPISPTTLELMRHAFYCGALSSFLLVTRAGQGGATAEDVTARFESLRLELDAFRYDIASLASEASPWAN